MPLDSPCIISVFGRSSQRNVYDHCYLWYRVVNHETLNRISHLSYNTLQDKVCHFYLEAMEIGPISSSHEKVADLEGTRNRFYNTNLAYGRLD